MRSQPTDIEYFLMSFAFVLIRFHFIVQLAPPYYNSNNLPAGIRVSSTSDLHILLNSMPMWSTHPISFPDYASFFRHNKQWSPRRFLLIFCQANLPSAFSDPVRNICMGFRFRLSRCLKFLRSLSGRSRRINAQCMISLASHSCSDEW